MFRRKTDATGEFARTHVSRPLNTESAEAGGLPADRPAISGFEPEDFRPRPHTLSEVERDFVALVSDGVRYLTAGSFLLYIVLASFNYAYWVGKPRGMMTILSGASAMVLLVIYFHFKRRREAGQAPVLSVNAFTTIVAVLALANCLSSMVLTENINWTGFLAITLVSEGYFFLVSTWFTSNVIFAIAAWYAVVHYFMPPQEHAPLWVMMLGSAVGLGSLIHVIRYLTRQRIENAAANERRQAWALREAKLMSDTASRAKSRLLANLSHEIRTPLVPIVTLSSHLLETSLGAAERRSVELIKQAGEELIGRVTDLLDMSRLEANRLQIENVVYSAEAVLERVSTLYATQAKEKGISLGLEIEPGLPSLLRGDPSRIGQVLANLVSNAIKFTSVGSITLRLRREPNGGAARLRFEVQDTGIGVPPEFRAKIFAPFEQGDASITRVYGGTGLGLAISVGLVESMGGEIGVDSMLPAGSLFWFTVAEVPAELAVGADAEKVAADKVVAGAVGSQLSGRRVLLVEDNAVNQEVFSLILEKLGLDVEFASNGAVAVAKALEGWFDLILMDCEMPVMDGFTAAERIRAAETGDRRVPIIALTAYVSEGTRDRCKESGMDDCLSKPISGGELSAALERWLGPLRYPVAAPEGDSPGSREAVDSRIFEALRDLERSTGDLCVDRMVQTFLELTSPKMSQISAATASGDWDAVGSIAHSMKSESGMIGAMAFSELCSTLQEAVRHGLSSVCEETLEKLHEEFKAVEADLILRCGDGVSFP